MDGLRRFHVMLIVLVTAVIIGQASACRCLPPYLTVCTAHYGIKATITGKLGNASAREAIQYNVRVDNVIRDQSATLRPGDTIVFSSDSHSCAYPDLMVGETYIIGGKAPATGTMTPPLSTCPTDMTYNECGSGCGPATCTSSNSTICPTVCVPGCFCDGGLVKEVAGGDRCIRQEDCPVGNSTTTTPTPQSCPAGMTYNECGSGCGSATCASPDQPVCPAVCVPGCYCDGGLVKETTGGSRCIRKEECTGQVATYSLYKCSSVVVHPDANGAFPDESEQCSSAPASAVSTTLLVLLVAIVMSWNV